MQVRPSSRSEEREVFGAVRFPASVEKRLQDAWGRLSLAPVSRANLLRVAVTFLDVWVQKYGLTRALVMIEKAQKLQNGLKKSTLKKQQGDDALALWHGNIIGNKPKKQVK